MAGAVTRTTGVTLVVVAPDFGVTATPVTRTVAPGTATTYTVTVTGQNGFAGDVMLSASGLPSGTSGSFSPPVVTGGEGTSTLTVTTGAATPAGSWSVTVTGMAGAVTRTTGITLMIGTLPAGVLTGAVAPQSGTQVLSTLGTIDWAHWGRTSATSYTHKAGVAPQISSVTLVGGAVATRYNDHAVGFSWTGGTPTASTTGSRTGIFVEGVNAGFRFTVPADTTQRRLRVYVGAWRAQGRMQAQLTDGSAPMYVDTSVSSGTTTATAIYTFLYRAAGPGQTLTITYTLNSAASPSNVTLQAATLE
jgi:hypothetical protein